MAIKRSSKIDSSFSSSSMTDLIFLLLVFFVLATTLINPIHALQVSLPTSDSNKQADNSSASITILGETGSYTYVLNSNNEYDSIDELREALSSYYDNSGTASKESPVMIVSLHCDRDNTSVQAFVDVAAMIQDENLKHHKAQNDEQIEDKYKLVLATKDGE